MMGIFGKDVHHFNHTHTDRMVPYEKTVHEHRAPTDDSIRIYQEMVEKIQKSIVSEIKLDVAGIEVAGVAFKDDYIDGDLKWMFGFNINGKRKEIILKFDRFEARELAHEGYLNPKSVTHKVMEKLGMHIAKEILINPEVSKSFSENILKR